MADDVGPPLDTPLTPRAQAALLGGDALSGDGDEEAKLRRELFRKQIQEEEEFSKHEQETYTKREAEMDKRRSEVEAAQAEQTRIGNRALGRFLGSQQDVPKAPEFNGPQAQQDAIAWMSLAAGFGAIAGGLSRYHTTTALNAFSGMMTGFAQGKLQAFETNYKTWQANTDRALEYNARAQREYRAIMDNAKMNIDQKANLMQMTADKWQDQLMADSARGRHIERMTQLMEAQARYEEQLQFRRDQMAQHHDDKMQEIDAGLAKKGLKRDENNNIVRDPKTAAAGSTWQKQAFEDWRAEYIQREGHEPSAEEERQFGQTLTTVRSAPAMALQKYLQENPKATSKDVIAFTANLAGDVAAIRAAGSRAGQIAVSAEEADSTFTLAKQASAASPRGQWQPLNRLYQSGQLARSDPRYRQFMAANEAAVTAYGATMSRSGANTVSAQQRAHDVLDTADSAEAYAAGINQLQKEVDQVRTAPARARATLLRNLGLVVDHEPGETPPAGGKVDLGDGWSGTVGQ